MFGEDNKHVFSEENFFYRGIDREGNRVKGRIEARNSREALEVLGDKGYIILKLKKKKNMKKRIGLRIKGEEKQLIFFSRQLAILLQGGLPLGQALDLLANQATDKKMKGIFREIKGQIMQGYSLFAAMSGHRGFFPEFFLQMIKMGEEAGLTTKILFNMAEHFERNLQLKREIKEVLRYPIFVLAVALGVMAFLIFNVLPYFSSLYLDYSPELPLLTLRLVKASEFIRMNFSHLLVSFMLLFLLFRTLKFEKKINFWLDIQKARFSPTKKYFWAFVGNNLSLLLKAGLTVDRSLEMVVEQTENQFLRVGLEKAEKDVKGGELLSNSLQKWLNPDPFFICMLRIGEETGKVDEMTGQAGSYYLEEMENWLKNMVSFLEPLLILLVAGLVGLIMIAMVLPMLDMIQIW